MRIYPIIIFIIGVGYFLLFQVSLATDFSSSNFTVQDPVISGGGGFGASTNFQLWSSLSQPAIGESSSASNQVHSGFLYFSEITVTPPPPPPPPPPPTTPPSGGGGGSIVVPPTTPPGTIPPIIIPIIPIIIGEIPLAQCDNASLFSRSDFNCDGEVDLKDLSIFFTSPQTVTARALSFVFSDWTKRLPVLRSIADSSGEEDTSQDFIDASEGLADVSSVVLSQENIIKTHTSSIGSFIRSAVQAIWTATKRLVVGIGKLFTF